MFKKCLFGILACGLSFGCHCASTTNAPLQRNTDGAPRASEVQTMQTFLSETENIDFCVKLHEEAAKCAEEFIDLNLELRAKYYPSFANMLANPEQKAQLRRIGIQETLADGTGDLASRRKVCTQYSKNGPPTPRSDVLHMDGCYKLSTCKEKVECMRPVLDRRYSEKAKAGQN